MSNDLAAVKLEEPAAEPDLVTPEPERKFRLLRRLFGALRPDRGRLSGITGWAIVMVAAIGMAASTPQVAGPDEPVHQVSAWYLSKHGFAPNSPVLYSVPGSLWVNPCFAGRPDITGACMPPRSAEAGTVMVTSLVNYPPPYYWVVGIGERLAARFGYEYADIGGRVASVLLNFGVLFLVSYYMRRRDALWGNFLLMVSTPMAVFLGVVVNPSGWEITCGIAMAAALSQVAWNVEGLEPGARSRTAISILVLATIALCTARPLGFVWASGLALAAVVLAPKLRMRSVLRVALAIAPGIVVGFLWFIGHPGLSGTTPVSPATVDKLATWFADSLLSSPEFLRHSFGVLGWLDTPEPALLFLLSIAAWAAILTRIPSIGLAPKICGIVGILIVPSAISAVGWAAYPAWWQGRYTMPFALGFVLLLLLRSGRLIPRMVSIVSGISVLSLGLMVWVNAIRYGYGLNSVELPASIGNPGISPTRLVIAAAAGLLLLLVSGYVLAQASRTKPDPCLTRPSTPAGQ